MDFDSSISSEESDDERKDGSYFAKGQSSLQARFDDRIRSMEHNKEALMASSKNNFAAEYIK